MERPAHAAVPRREPAGRRRRQALAAAALGSCLALASVAGCATRAGGGGWAGKTPYEDTYDPRTLPRFQGDGAASAAGRRDAAVDRYLDDVANYCADVMQWQNRRATRARWFKNGFATLGVVSGTIIAPAFAQGSAVRAWAGVSGAASGALSGMFDGATGGAVGPERPSLAQDVELFHQRIQDADGEDTRRLDHARGMYLRCRSHDARSPRRDAEPDVAAASAAAR